MISYPAHNAPADDPARMLRARVNEVMQVEETKWDETGRGYAFIGKLHTTAQDAYGKLKVCFAEVGYTPALRENDEGERETIFALKGPLRDALNPRPWLNIVLFLATVATTTIFGGMFATVMTQTQASRFTFNLPVILAKGIPFSLTLLLILGVHEFGHYFQAKRHGLPVTLPFFIPIPLPGTLGTMGAFIQMRGAVENRRALFDVGVGGPLAGLIIAVPLFVAGLLASTIIHSPAPPNRSYLMSLLIALFRPDAIDNGIVLNPVLLAARFGIVITAINLLPIGQLDGGHIAYAAMGRKWARWIGYATAATMLVLGLTVSPTWLVWLVFAVFSGFGHVQPLDDITPLDVRRSVAFIASFVLFLSIFSVRPF